MNKQEAIERIEKRKSTLNGWEELTRNRAFNEALDIVRKIDEPQKVTVPKFVAEWIEEGKRSGWHLQKALYRLDDDDKVGDWAYDENDDLIPEKVDMIARAWLAYPNITVEQEKLYTVEIPNPNNTSPKYKLMLVKGTNGVEILRDYYNEKRDPYIFRLTEAEIKEDFEWAWQFASEVE